ncbi:MAG: glycoside hydrolase family 97 protein [Balneolaceae bacterium]|nr:glycoside hydrolase family 97 protein [Balneolaceae bacterium]
MIKSFSSLLYLTPLVLIFACTSGPPYHTASPNGSLELVFTMEEGIPRYQLSREGRALILPSRLGFEFKEAPPLGDGMAVAGITRRGVDEIWEQPWGEAREIRNHYNELRVTLEEPSVPGRTMDIVFRLFNDGLGFRYEWPEQEEMNRFEITGETTEFVLAGDYDSWWIPAYGRDRYEYLYKQSPVSAIDTVHTPFTMKTGNDLYLSIHEAALVDFASMTLARSGGTTLEADLVPWSDGVKVKAGAPHKSPWRTVQVADTPGGLITSYLVLNLNEPNRLDDLSWIEPGKYVGVWWEMHLGISTWGSGPNHGATTENAMRYIDFASKHGFDGVLVEGWNIGWDGNWLESGTGFSFTESYPDFDLEKVANYALDNGTRLIGHHETAGSIDNYERQMEEAFALYEKHGVRAVKTGYVDFGRDIERVTADGDTVDEWHHGQYMVNHFQRVTEVAAKHRIMINAHEPIKDTGLRRTWPNFVTREGARGQEYNSPQGGGNGPDHTVILPFTRMLAGPMDFTPGTFDLNGTGEYANNVPTTLAKQLALYVVIYSPLQMASDLPENYRANSEPFQFIKDVPADWEETLVLNGRIGEYVTILRKGRENGEWYLGSITGGVARSLEVPLTFLDPGREYVAEIYGDGPEADWKKNPMDIRITEETVDSETVMTMRLAPGGGQAVRFRPSDS